MPKDDQKELFVVVDKEDKIIDYKTRYECHHDKKLIHRGIGVVIFNHKGEILLQKRSPKKDLFPGFYTISCGGHVNKGETYLETAKRELKEELGIKANLKIHSRFLLESEKETEMDTIFTGVYNGPFKPDPDEVEKVEFLSTDEVKKMVHRLTPFAKKGLKELKIL